MTEVAERVLLPIFTEPLMVTVAEFCYKCTDVYDPTSEGGIPYDDPTVNVQWPDCGCEHKTSAKDKLHEPFAAQKFEFFEKW